MKFHRLLAIASPLLLPLFAAAAAADTITTTDGRVLKDVTVVDATAQVVTYQAEGKGSEKTISSDAVLGLEFERYPKLVDQALTALEDGLTGDAVNGLREYVDEVFEQNKRVRMAWAPGYALHRLVEIYLGGGDLATAAKAAEELIRRAPDSFYAPHAWLVKAESEAALGQRDLALETLNGLRAAIDSGGLSKRWTLECDLALAILDPALEADARMARITEVASRAGSEYPTVRNRARVAEGESFLSRGDLTADDIARARGIFEKIIADPSADSSTLAGAYTGLGECLYQLAVAALNAEREAQPMFKEALLAFLRAASYRDQARYRPKALFYAARAYDFLEAEDSRARARRLYRAVLDEYPSSPWAAEASKNV